MTHCVILLHMSQKLMSHVKVPTESEGLVAVKGRWLSETKKGCSGSPVAVKDVYGSSSAGYGRGKSGCAVSFFVFFFTLLFPILLYTRSNKYNNDTSNSKDK